MFESAELGHVIEKETFKREVPKLRAAGCSMFSTTCWKKDFPVVILISGVDGSGKGETINLFYSGWTRGISTLAFSAPSDEERSRPYMWRYWRALPPQGKIGIFAGSWYSQPIADSIMGPWRAPIGRPSRRHQPLRGDAGQRGRAGAETLVSSVERRPEAAAEGAREEPAHRLARDQGQLRTAQDP